MAFFNIQDYPFLFVVLVSVCAVCLTRIVWLSIEKRVKFKTQSSKDAVLFSAYTTVGCILLSWACIYLGQAQPIVQPK